MSLRQHAPVYLALSAAAAVQPALAQSSDDWTGGYVGGFVGRVMDPDNGSDDGYRVRAQGPAAGTNPFIRQNPNSNGSRRSDDDFDLDSVRLGATCRF